MNLNLPGKIILVTGGAKGIGEGISRVLAAEGATPVIVDRDGPAILEAVAAIEKANGMARRGLARRGFARRGLAHGIVAELTDPEQCKRAVEQTMAQFGRIDGLVNNAGVNDSVGLETGDYERFMASLHKNLVHYYLMAHHALPALKISKGPIVNISSKVAETGQGGTSAYAAANGGRNALTREWAVELLPYGIRVNAVIVAESWTPLYANWLKTQPDPVEKLRQIVAKIPLENRMTTTEEIASTVAFLLSDRSSHTTGQLIHVDGGYTHLDRAITN